MSRLRKRHRPASSGGLYKRTHGNGVNANTDLQARFNGWQPPNMTDLPSWKNVKRIAIDIETRDDHLKELGIGVRRGGYIVGIAFGIEDHKSYYLPIAHDGGDNLPKPGRLELPEGPGESFQG